MAKSNVKDNGELGVSATIKSKKPKKTDYYLSGINIEPAENGIIVSCSYRLKPGVQEANRKKEIYCDSYMEGEKHVFEDYSGVTEFLTKKIGSMESAETNETDD